MGQEEILSQGMGFWYTHLPEKSVLILGNLGECVGSMNRGGILNIEGSCSSMLGAFQSSERIVVRRDVGDRLAMNMKGGDIVVMGSAGIDAWEWSAEQW